MHPGHIFHGPMKSRNYTCIVDRIYDSAPVTMRSVIAGNVLRVVEFGQRMILIEVATCSVANGCTGRLQHVAVVEKQSIRSGAVCH